MRRPAHVDALLPFRLCPERAHVDVSAGRLPRDVEASAYFILAEALMNVVKHAVATHAVVRAAVDEHGLSLEVRDDGVGGADPKGFGIMGTVDRVGALGGELRIESGDHGGPVVATRLPLSTQAPSRSG
jgi:signal transduction histidine kinase